MDTKTFELFQSYDEAVKKFNLEDVSKDKLNDRLVAVNSADSADSAEYEELPGMNRAQRRRWLKQHRKVSLAKKGTGVEL
jgi:hypothetical protein